MLSKKIIVMGFLLICGALAITIKNGELYRSFAIAANTTDATNVNMDFKETSVDTIADGVIDIASKADEIINTTTSKLSADTPVTTDIPKDTITTNNFTGETNTSEMQISGEIDSVISVNKHTCVELNQSVDEVIFRVTGPKDKTFVTQESTPTAYCCRLDITDLPDGEYQFIIEAKKGDYTGLKIYPLEVKRSKTVSSILESATDILNQECSVIGSTTLEECKNNILDRYKAKTDCQNLSEAECRELLENTYMDTMLYAEKRYRNIEEKMDELIQAKMSVGQIEEILNDEPSNQQIIISIKNKEKGIKVLKAIESFVLDANQELIQSAPIAITVDSDGDSIPDDLEKRIGTNPEKADTDGDGYKDGEEIIAGYNPLGDGKLEIKLSAIDQAILSNQTIEHPTSSGAEKENFTIERIENVATTEYQTENDNGYMIYGKAEPNSVATVYIYSDIPVITTVEVDEYGNWEYYFEEPLEDGEHEMYVAINDNTGKVLDKSKPLDFLIQKARAVSPQDLVSLSDDKKSASDSMINYYILSALVLTFVGILIFFFTIFKQKNKFQQ